MQTALIALGLDASMLTEAYATTCSPVPSLPSCACACAAAPHVRYDETAKMVSEAALCLVEPGVRAALPCAGQGGIHTPSTAFGNVLVDRLHARGICFKQGLAVNDVVL